MEAYDCSSPETHSNHTNSGRSIAFQYFQDHRIVEALEDAVHDLAAKLPRDPINHLALFFLERSKTEEPVSAAPRKPHFRQEIFHDQELSPEPSVTLTNRVAWDMHQTHSELDTAFAAYLNGLASSVRRATT